MSRPPRPPAGIEFPPGEKNDRSSTQANKAVWQSSFEAINKNVAGEVAAERNWRFKYNKYIEKHVQLSLESPKNALAAAHAGIEKLYADFEFVRGDTTYKVGEAMSQITDHQFHTGFIQGDGSATGYEVPYKGQNLKGEALIAQLRQWAEYGTIEPDTAEALIKMAKENSWADLSKKYFVLLGAGAAMGPFLVLMSLGANVIACDLDRAPIWERLIGVARKSAGSLTFALRKPQSECADDAELFANAGCNLMTETPEIANWLCDLYPGNQLTIGSYVYLDGGLFVRVSLACDAIMKKLCEARADTAIAFLCTPTDNHAIPNAAHEAARANYNSMGWKNLVLLPIRSLSSKMLVNNAPSPVTTESGSSIAYVNGIVVPQGPNYALAKRMQHWRAIIARSNGHVVSSNIAPSTATISVVKNRQFAWAYDGMPFFQPMEIFEQETSNAVMAGLLIHDLNNSSSASHPDFKLENPLQLFSYGSFHGGVWRCAYTVGSIGEVSVLIHFAKVLWPVIAGLLLLVFFYLFWF